MPQVSDTQLQQFATIDTTSLGAHGQPFLAMSSFFLTPTTTPEQHHKMQQDYASTADSLLQNLSMSIGNPSARCFANAPWRAFTWTCARLGAHAT